MQKPSTDLVVMRMLPRWALPLEQKSRYKGAKGGRSSGKSHYFAERLVYLMVQNPDLQWVCIREIQKSLKFSAKKLIEGKIRELGVGHLFDVLLTEIRRIGGTGIIVFQGMQDHTAESIKSLEGFDGAWVEEASSLSARSLELLLPTIRKEESEIWFSWNPDLETDAIEQFLNPTGSDAPVEYLTNEDAIVVHVNYLHNPMCPATSRKTAEWTRSKDLEKYQHIWLGGYKRNSEAQIFKHCRVDEFTPDPQVWDGPYQGLDFGFSADPLAFVRCWVHERKLYVEHEAGGVGIELDDVAGVLSKALPTAHKLDILADNSRPESISFLRRHGLPRIMAADKWAGSVEDGIAFIQSFEEVIIHVRCKEMQGEATAYKYKVNRGGQVTDQVADKDNHYWDAVRYALSPLIRKRDIIFETL
jgi:phage terminase large subunit